MSEPSASRRRVLRTVIADDEPLARDCMRLALAGLDGVEIVAECADGDAAAAAILDLAPDVVLLDVSMPSADGFDVVARVGPERMPVVVFVTAFDEHALRAFDVHAIDYVLKPFEDERLRAAVTRARDHVAARDAGDLARRLAALLEDAPAAGIQGRWVRRLRVPVRDRIRFVPVDDVEWFEAAGNYVRIHVGGERHLIRIPLGRLEQQLDPRRFARVHRSAIVNLERVREVEPFVAGDYIAFLQSGHRLRVSRTYRDRLLDDPA